MGLLIVKKYIRPIHGRSKCQVALVSVPSSSDERARPAIPSIVKCMAVTK